MIRAGSLMFLFLVLATDALADVRSGPAPGEKVAGLKVLALTGEHENKEVDYAAERKEKPTVYLFVQADKWDRPMARFLKVLDGAAPKVHKDATVVAVWLTDDQDTTKAYLPKAQSSLKLDATTLAVFPGKNDGPEDWGINPDAHLTAVVVDGGKVAARFGWISINDTVVPDVEAALKKAIDAR